MKFKKFQKKSESLKILNLHDAKDIDWRSWIRATDKDIHKNFFNEIKIKKRKNLTEIAKDLQVTYKMLKDWRSGRSGIPLWVLIEIKEKFKKDFSKDIKF